MGTPQVGGGIGVPWINRFLGQILSFQNKLNILQGIKTNSLFV
jgi:hypothetical protein